MEGRASGPMPFSDLSSLIWVAPREVAAQVGRCGAAPSLFLLPFMSIAAFAETPAAIERFGPIRPSSRSD